MAKRYAVVLFGLMFCGGLGYAAQKPAPGGYVLERDADVATNEPGTHNGGGETIGYSFFKEDAAPRADIPQARPQARLGNRIPRADRGRDLLRPQRPRDDDDRRQGVRSGTGHRGADEARKFPRTQADRRREPRHPDQLRTEVVLTGPGAGAMAVTMHRRRQCSDSSRTDSGVLARWLSPSSGRFCSPC